ncbi:MAG: hypothetical protein JXD23_17375 [Spirochaetales bacterium]|nr:hypothetical protein [Spirochaetales bacterium]
MPILPIDLQTLFAQMNQVGKEQSTLKEGAAIQSSMQGMGVVKQAEQRDSSVNESQNVGEGVESLKNEGKKQREKSRGKKREREKEEKKEYFSDPALGHHIDIKS